MAEKYKISTFAEGNRMPFLSPLIVFTRNVVINPKNAAPPRGLPIAISNCNPFSVSDHATPIADGLISIIMLCPITREADNAQKMMMITAIAVMDFVEFFFTINKYLMFFDMQIYKHFIDKQ